MALINNPNLYTGGAVRFDTTPTVNMYSNVLAKQQAKMDALEQYQQSRINSINDSGLRDIDRKLLDDKLADVRSYYNQNKKAIQKGNSQEAFDYEKKFRDIRGLVAGSKDLASRHEAALKFYNERLKVDQRLPDDYMKELSDNDLPYDEAKGFDVVKWSSGAKPFNQDKFIKEFADIKRVSGKPTYQKIEGQPLKLAEVIEERFDDNAKQVIAARAADRYDNSYSFSEQVKQEAGDPIARKRLGDLFEKEFGLKPSLMSDYAVAYTMERLQPSVVKTKAVDNKEAIMTRNEQFRIDQQQRAYKNSISKMYQYFNLLEASDANITAKAEELYNNNYNSRDPQTGEVPTNDETKEAIFGKKGGVMIIDADGNYIRATKDADNKLTPTGEKASKEEAIIRIRGNIKNNLPKKVQPGGQSVRTPKDIKNTKMTTKPTKPKPY